MTEHVETIIATVINDPNKKLEPFFTHEIPHDAIRKMLTGHEPEERRMFLGENAIGFWIVNVDGSVIKIEMLDPSMEFESDKKRYQNPEKVEKVRVYGLKSDHASNDFSKLIYSQYGKLIVRK